MASILLRLFGVLLFLTAVVVALSRAPDRSVQSLVARWAPPPSEFVEVKGQIVHLRDEGPRGDAEPLVLIHGTSSSLHTWEGWVRALKTQKRVITLDVPGFGLTGPFSGQYKPDDYRGDTLAGFVIDVLNHLQVQRFSIGGNSMGGEIAWRVAHLAPARVHKLILVDASGPPWVAQSMPLGFVLARLPLVNKIGEHLTPRALVAQGLANVYGDPSKVTSEQVDRYYELALREGNRRALGLRVQQLERGEHAQRINGLKLPTLILWGGRDRLIPPGVAKDFEQRITGSKLVMWPELGHVPQEEDPARTVAEVRAFLGL
jgi:pimeloyl-ACP methyl ester carboxylesterase